MGAAYLPKLNLRKYVKVADRPERFSFSLLPEERDEIERKKLRYAPVMKKPFRTLHSHAKIKRALNANAVKFMLKKLEE